MFKRIIKWFKHPAQMFCKHEFIRKVDFKEAHTYLLCMKCLKRTPGIELYGERPRNPNEHIYRKSGMK